MNRDRTAALLLAAFAAVSFVHLAALLAGADLLGQATKPALMPLLAAWAAVRGGPRALVVALLFGWGGDTLLQVGGEVPFLAGMGCFAAGHVCYVVMFVRRGAFADRRRALAATAGYAAAWAAVVTLLWPDLGDLRFPVAVYSLLLTATAVTGAGTGAAAGLGGALFLLSDTLIATGLADWPQLPAPQFWIMLTYIAAQYLLARSLAGRADGERSPEPQAGLPRTDPEREGATDT